MPQITADALLLLVTVIWGTTFVLVKGAIASIRPFTFLAVRFFIAGMSLLLLFLVREFQHFDRRQSDRTVCFPKGGIVTGLTLLLSYATQTFGLLTVSAGKAAFITGLSVVIVPIASAFLLKTVPNLSTGLGVLLATLGLGFMSLTLPFSIHQGDFLVFLCAIGFAAHILLVGVHSRNSDPLVFSAVQLLVVALGAFVAAILTEWPLSVPKNTWGAIIYTSTVATAVTVLLQSAVQKYTSSTHTALIFSAEPVFGAIFAWVILGEILSGKELIGAFLILAGMVISEISPYRKRQLGRKQLTCDEEQQ